MRISRTVCYLFCAAMMLTVSFSGDAYARTGETEQVIQHLRTRYKAKKVKIPFMWLARVAVKVARPAGVKSFSLTVFEDLKFSAETLDEEMQATMRESFGPEWSPILRIRSRTGEQVYMYMRDAGKSSVKLSVVTIGREQATVIRATVNPEKLAEFIDDPTIFGISLNNEKKAAAKIDEASSDVDRKEQ